MALEELQNGRYRNVRLLGSGGMGEVYLMNDNRVNRQVAIKVIRTEGVSYPGADAAKDAARLFQREAKAIAALEHPNILPLYDFGEETHDDVMLSYMVMPYCSDGSLATWLRQNGTTITLSPQDIAHLVEQAAEALQYAHEHQVIHLDVKPPNFLLRSNRKYPNRPTLLLADFGIARSSATVSNSSRTIRGTPTSMAPEQWSSEPVAASDQYALAVMVYELLTGRPPFIGGMEQLMYQHFNVQPPAPSTFNAQLPRELDAVMLRALAKKPEERFPSIIDFANAFEQTVHLMPPIVIVGPKPSNANGMTNDLRTTLAISAVEARSGTSRVITLPGGGQSVRVTIPPGAYDGQVIRLQGLGDGNATIPVNELVLTIAIAKPEVVLSSSNTLSSAHTIITPQSKGPQAFDSASDHNLPTIASAAPRPQTPEKQPLPPKKKRAAPLAAIVSIISVLVVLLIIGGAGYFYINYNNGRQNSANALNITQSQTATATAHSAKATATATATPKPPNGLFIAGTYNGSMTDEVANQTSSISVFIGQSQGSGVLTGSFTYRSGSTGTYSLKGKVDMQGNFSFTVQQPAGKLPLYFYGQYQTGNFLKGLFCSSNTNSCSAGTGYFTVGPRF
jgi:eukaryotic-like serine/threonine-protein kinase